MNSTNEKNGFLIKLKALLKRWFIDALSSMALGLFSSLIIGLIIAQLATIPFLQWLTPVSDMLSASSPVVGAAIGVAIAAGLKCAPLVVYSSAATGAVGYAAGGPVGAYIGALLGAEIGRLIAGKTKIDILLVPLVTVVSGGVIGYFVGPPIQSMMNGLGAFINMATTLHPVPMGIIVSVVVGMALTAPISSAALCIMLGLDGIAAGAATVGCCANMIGFAVISYKDNGIGGLLAQGLGTSMLQVSNIVKKPIIWLPSILASAILGPIATKVLVMTNNAYGAGMGTSGLVGPINTYIAMSDAGVPLWEILLKIGLLQFILPAALSLLFWFILYKMHLIKDGDMKLSA